jgi:hypothetical protein
MGWGDSLILSKVQKAQFRRSQIGHRPSPPPAASGFWTQTDSQNVGRNSMAEWVPALRNLSFAEVFHKFDTSCT